MDVHVRCTWVRLGYSCGWGGGVKRPSGAHNGRKMMCLHADVQHAWKCSLHRPALKDLACAWDTERWSLISMGSACKLLCLAAYLLRLTTCVYSVRTSVCEHPYLLNLHQTCILQRGTDDGVMLLFVCCSKQRQCEYAWLTRALLRAQPVGEVLAGGRTASCLIGIRSWQV